MKNPLLGLSKEEWTTEDWADLYFAMEGVKRRICERHGLPVAKDAPTTQEDRFVKALDVAIAFHTNNTNDPHGIGNAVIAALAEVRSAFVNAHKLTHL